MHNYYGKDALLVIYILVSQQSLERPYDLYSTSGTCPYRDSDVLKVQKRVRPKVLYGQNWPTLDDQ